MKIESITLHHISMPLVAPFETSFGRETDRLREEAPGPGLHRYDVEITAEKPELDPYAVSGKVSLALLEDLMATAAICGRV